MSRVTHRSPLFKTSSRGGAAVDLTERQFRARTERLRYLEWQFCDLWVTENREQCHIYILQRWSEYLLWLENCMGKVPRHSRGYSWGNRVYGNNYFMWTNRGKGTRTAGNPRKRLPFLWEPAVEIAVRLQWRTQDFTWGTNLTQIYPLGNCRTCCPALWGTMHGNFFFLGGGV